LKISAYFGISQPTHGLQHQHDLVFGVLSLRPLANRWWLLCLCLRQRPLATAAGNFSDCRRHARCAKIYFQK